MSAFIHFFLSEYALWKLAIVRWVLLYSSKQSIEPSGKIFASKPIMTLIFELSRRFCISCIYRGTQDDDLLTCSVNARVFNSISAALSRAFFTVRSKAE